jgi:immune inhibitor A
VTIANRNDNRVAKRVDAAAGGEYFLLENVKVVGWDAYCYNSGMLVTHIAAAGHMEPADNSASCNSGQAGDVFPGTGNYTSYTDTTTPNMKSSGGVNTAKPITNITYPSYVTTFDFMQ